MVPIAIAGLLGLSVKVADAQESSAPVLTVRSGVAINGVVRGGRVPFFEDAVQYQRVQGGQPPKAGDTVTLPNGSQRVWESLTADAEGWFTGPALSGGGYLSASVDSPTEQTYLLEASGDGTAYVNGEPRAGDAYAYGWLRLPVRLRQGTNQLLFSVGRGRLRVRLLPVSAPLLWNTDDATVPDLQTGGNTNAEPLWAAVPLINTTDQTLTGLTVTTSVENGAKVTTPLPPIPPMTVCKVGFQLQAPSVLTGEQATLRVQIAGGAKNPISSAETTINLRVRQPGQTYKQTFRSGIDGSVQYFGVNPAQKPSTTNALILSLHGASVEAIGQADAYSPKDWATLIAPTNRRPYGFDWEDWGRLDALEVLERGQQFPHDPARVFLTGHSMGGHGTWSVGSLFSDRFAVIGPSAGWISFTSYADARRPGSVGTTPPPPITVLLQRGSNQYDTLSWGTNLLEERIYIIHGDADDNVPVTEARHMREYLASISHPQVDWHEEKGAGHWWDDPKTPGAECVDWRPLFALFETERLRPQEWNTVNFTTPNPAVSGTNRWVRIEQQEKTLEPSVAQLGWNSATGTITGTTKNIATFSVLPERLPGNTPLRSLVVDNQTVTVKAAKPSGKEQAPAPVTLRRVAGVWQQARTHGVAAGEKSPARGGPFKTAFGHEFILVYGTKGTPEETRWARARARFDAEGFWYRGNGSPLVISDREYNDQTMRQRSVILYGNADTNDLWKKVLENSPIQVRRGQVQVGSKTITGDTLACLFLRPKKGSDVALVGVVAGTGDKGSRLTECLQYFSSGVAFPDWVVADAEVLRNRPQGVVAAGYFGNDWRLESGDAAWRDASPESKTVFKTSSR